ncbi:MAG: RNA degradosome polyphosphate kinase, partial [Pseudomonadota bacterium]
MKHKEKNTSLPADRYNNREISWLLFNQRVLEEARNKDNPLFERLRFLSISASNMDEFYSVRVAGLMEIAKQRNNMRNMRGETPSEQLKQIYHKTAIIMEDQQRIFAELNAELKKEGVTLVTCDDLTSDEKDYVGDLFENEIFPLLTPLAIDPAHPFPFIPHEGIALTFSLRSFEGVAAKDIIIPIPLSLKRFYRLPSDKIRFIAIEDIIARHSDRLFPKHAQIDIGMFKILRDTDIDIEEEAEDLVREFETALRKRNRGDIVRLKILKKMPPYLQAIIIDEYSLPGDAIIMVDQMVGLSSLQELIVKERHDLLFKPFSARMPARIRDYGGDIFKAVAANDFLVHHPYESFDSVVQFLQQAADDPDVVAIKFTLYRTSEDSPIVKALIEAAENGKNVTAIVELKARFDEAANIRQARALERAGAHVVFGFMKWKTHAKLATIIRREGAHLRTYTHIGTGNYHPQTAKIYTDISFFTANEALGRDAIKIFNFVTGYIPPQNLEKMSVSPITLKSKLLDLIQTEIKNARQGKPAFMVAKMNSLVDPEIIDALYYAARAGVHIYLNIRGICCLKPGVKGLSENIHVVSLVGRFLEHARMVVFANGGDYGSEQNKIFISSADWMPRNLDRRVESLVPIEDINVKKQIIEHIFPAYFTDNCNAWWLQNDGSYARKR